MTAAHSLFHRVLSEIPEVLQRPVRFVGAGVLNTAFGYGVFAIAVWQGVSPQIALILQFALGVLWNYFTHAQLVFSVRGIGRLPYYVVAYCGIYAFNAALLAALLNTGFTPYAAQAIALPFVVILSFLLVSKALGVPVRQREEAAR